MSASENSGLRGKTALITGGGDGIGREITLLLARRGVRTLIFDLDEERARAVAQEVEASGGTAAAVQGSVAEAADVERAFAACEARFGALDILVNNAGISCNAPTLDLTDEDWDAAIAVNLRGVFLCARAAGRRMVAQRAGVILNMASMYGVVAAPERLAYCATKSAVCMMTKALALEWGGDNVRVNALAPGYVDTTLLRRLAEAGRLDLDALAARTPLKRLASPEEIAELAVMLCALDQSFVTGQIIGADGGWSANGYL